MSVFLLLIFYIALLVLCIMFYVKVWNMTNDVRAIREMLFNAKQYPAAHNASVIYHDMGLSKENKEESTELAAGSLVVEKKTGKQMRVKEVKDGKCSCYTGNYTQYCGDFSLDEIEIFADYASKLKK